MQLVSDIITITYHCVMYLSTNEASSCPVPNPPGSITVVSQTVESINFTWASPLDMDQNQYNFTVSSVQGSLPTSNNWFLLDNLQSGTLNSISVVTVGLLGYESSAVTANNYTSKRDSQSVTVNMSNVK